MTLDSLWGDDFVIKETPKQAKKVIEKIKQPKTDVKSVKRAVSSKKLSIEDKLKLITEEVNRILGRYESDTQVITTYADLVSYIDKSIENKVIAIDTETNNSLDPITCKIMGGCIYTPGRKNAYIPINHTTLTGERLDWQITENQLAEQFSRLIEAKTDIIMHNGKFDYEVIKCTCGVELPITWDTMIGAKVLDENERSAGLKQQYIDKIDPSIEKYSIDHLFSDIEYAVVDPNVFALYAATDSYMTYKLYEWQLAKFNDPDLSRLFDMFKRIEMPLVPVIAEMELTGMCVDQDYGKLLSNKYHTQLDQIDAEINIELEKLKPQIDAWRSTADAQAKQKNRNGELVGKSKSEQLVDPINLASPTQLAILFYDVLGIEPVSKKSPRGTGEDELKTISERYKLPIAKIILKRREIVKLLTTYIDVIPELATRWPDGRVRTHFNQYGAATGRLSSSEPLNFQNIPSHNREIRMLFMAKPGYRIIGGDFSGQEPRLTSQYSQDPAMIQAYKAGKDLYAEIASLSFDKPYEECLEFYPEGTEIDYEGQKVICGHKTHQNKAGKQRRTWAKAILLGIIYGRGAKSVGEQIGKSTEEAQEIIDKFFTAFPKVKLWINTTIDNARKLGYVEDIAGRRRRLPDIKLPKYDIKDLSADSQSNFNPIIGCNDRIIKNPNIDKYRKLLDKVNNRKEYERIQTQALTEGIEIHDNTGFIAQAERQAVNSRVQGGAATLTKAALICIQNDQRLKEIDAKIINTVHDEILIEAPEQYSELAGKYLTEDMINSAKYYVPDVPMDVDYYNVHCWYFDEFVALVQSEFKDLEKSGHSDLESFELMCQNRTESTREQIYEIVHELMIHRPDNVVAVYE